MKRIISVILALGLAAASAGCGKKEEKSEQPSSIATNVTVTEAKCGDISNTVTYTGEIKSVSTVSVAPKVSGKIVAMNVEEGQYVNAGAVLFKIDDTDLRLQYNQAQASYNSARVGYENMKNSTTKQTEMQAKQAYENAQNAYDREKQLYDNNSDVKLAQTQLETARQAYESAKLNYDNNLVAAKNALVNAETAYNNTAALYNAQGATKVEYDAAKSAYENAAASLATLKSNQSLALENSRAAVTQAEESLKKVEVTAGAGLQSAELALKNAKETYELTVNVTNKANTKSAQAGMESAAAAMKMAENSVKNATVTAPISGYVSSKSVSVGEMAQAGMTAVTIHNTNYVDGEVHVTESVISRLSEGTPATVNVKSAGVENLGGTITSINQVKDAATGMYTVKVSIPNENGLLKTGMFADITLQTAVSQNVIFIPSEAVLQNGDERFVYISNGDTAEKRIITEGVTNGTSTEITSGINDGDLIIMKGKDYITEKNNKIKVVEN